MHLPKQRVETQQGGRKKSQTQRPSLGETERNRLGNGEGYAAECQPRGPKSSQAMAGAPLRAGGAARAA